jgi:hypothetical protein
MSGHSENIGRHCRASLSRPRPGDRRRRERGSALLMALLILGSLSMIGTSLVLTSVAERRTAGYYRDSLKALAAAETGVAFGKRTIQDMNLTMTDSDGDGYADFAMSDTLSWGGEYEILGEATDITGLGIAAFRSNGFTLVAEGRFQGAVRRVRAEIVHDSFLKYARFVAAAGTSYDCGAVLTGEVYCGGDLGVPSGCGANSVQFLEFVATVGDIPNANYAIFYRGYVTGTTQLDLGNSCDFALMRNKAKGIATTCNCEGIGSVGIYINSAGGFNPLGTGTNPVNLGLFDFHNTTLAPGDTVITYNSVAVPNTVTGQAMRLSEFNGVLYFEGDGKVFGTADGRTAHSMSIFATDDMFVTNNIVTGHTGFNPGTGAPSGGGDPVNIGLIAYDYVYIDRYTPRVLQVDAALMSTISNWRCDGGTIANHPTATSPQDLDMDGIVGETPYNNDPTPGIGWNEATITANTWVLNINGPMITHDGGSAWPWNDASVLAAASGPTRRYNYDMDITEYPPPCFPVPLNLWKDVSWTEIFETDSTLVSYLPN